MLRRCRGRWAAAALALVIKHHHKAITGLVKQVHSPLHPQAITGLTKLETYNVACQRSLYDLTLTWEPVVIPKGFFNNLPGCVKRRSASC